MSRRAQPRARPFRRCASAVALLLAAGCDRGAAGPLERIGSPVPAAGEDGGRPAPVGRDARPVDREDAPADAAGERPDLGRERAEEALAEALGADESARRGELSEALAGYGRAIALDPGSPWLRVARAWLLSRSGRLPEAREELEVARAAADGNDELLDAALHHAVGETRVAQGDEARARQSFRAALGALSHPFIARALLRVTPDDSPQREEVRRLALGTLLRSAGAAAGATRGRWPLAAALLPDGRVAAVEARPRQAPPALPDGYQYVLVVTGTEQPDAGSTSQEAPLGDAQAVRMHDARVSPVDLGGGRGGALVSVTWIGAGLFAPASTLTTLASASESGLVPLFSRATSDERESPPGCRRSWSVRVELEDADDDGLTDTAVMTRRETVTRRLATAPPDCVPEERTLPPRRLGLGTVGRPAAPPDASVSE